MSQYWHIFLNGRPYLIQMPSFCPWSFSVPIQDSIWHLGVRGTPCFDDFEPFEMYCQVFCRMPFFGICPMFFSLLDRDHSVLGERPQRESAVSNTFYQSCVLSRWFIISDVNLDHLTEGVSVCQVSHWNATNFCLSLMYSSGESPHLRSEEWFPPHLKFFCREIGLFSHLYLLTQSLISACNHEYICYAFSYNPLLLSFLAQIVLDLSTGVEGVLSAVSCACSMYSYQWGLRDIGL